jgi:hypothetical protein
MNYYVDLLFRPRAVTAAGGQPSTASEATTVGAAPSAQATLTPEMRAEVTRVVLHGVSEGRLDDVDRSYLAQLVAARTGLPADEAQRRTADVENRAREASKEAADKISKAGAMFSFWTFMSLLFGGAAATLAAMLGGQLRDGDGRLATTG